MSTYDHFECSLRAVHFVRYVPRCTVQRGTCMAKLSAHTPLELSERPCRASFRASIMRQLTRTSCTLSLFFRLHTSRPRDLS